MKKFILFFASSCLIVLYSCQVFDKSENRFINEFYNPQQSVKIMVFEKMGNATVNNSIQVSVQPYPHELNNEETGNIFIADNIESREIHKDSLLKIKWLNNNIVEISYPKSLRVIKADTLLANNFNKTVIKYIELD